ncbi:hypothetical protein HOF92_10965, partial [bacterium]|nr:hypothetical protein [bacterium]
LIGPPRPFDQLSFYLHDYRGILNPSEGDQSDNNKIQSSIDDLSTRLPGIRQAYVDILESMKKEWPPETAENIPYDQLEQLFTQPPLEALPSTVPFLFPRDMVLYSQAEALDLDQLHLQKRVRLISAGIQQALVNAKVANLALDACLLLSLKKDIKKNLQKCIILIKPMTLSMVELSKKHTERLNVYRGFQDTFQIATGDQKSKIVKYFYKYKSREKSFWEKKAFYVLDEEKQLDLSKAFEELITRYTPTNGVVFVKNPTKTLRVHSIPQFEGKLVVVTSGKVVLQNISVKSPPQDLLTFISYGKMKLGGSIQASLGPMSEMEIAGTDLRIDGNLVLDRVINPEDLKGVLSYDPRIASGTTSPDSDSNAKKSYYYVGFGPRAIAKSFHRVGD